MKEFIIEQKDSGQRVDKYLMRILPEASKSFLYKMMRKKNIVLNDKKIEGNELIARGDSVKIWFSDETFNKFSQTVSALDVSEFEQAYKTLKGISVVYEDNNFLIVYKPLGILSQKASDKDLSLNEWIVGYCLEKNCIDRHSLSVYKPSIVNRLDRNTSGLVLAGKTVFGLNTLGRIVKDRSLSKYYITYVWGKLEGEELIEGYHYKDSDINKVDIIDELSFNSMETSKKEKYIKIKTGYKALKHFEINIDGKKECITKLEVELITGKSHQIRAHLASIGHPLVGDNKYGNNNYNKYIGIKYQILHAYRLVFPNINELEKLSGKEIICQHLSQEDFEARFLKN